MNKRSKITSAETGFFAILSPQIENSRLGLIEFDYKRNWQQFLSRITECNSECNSAAQ